jgi:signal transduction histidine kinase
MRLADFILANVEPILLEWERFARSLAPGSEMSVLALRDHAEDLLRTTARDMSSAQTREQQSDKSKGRGAGGVESTRLDHASADHAAERLSSGFNLNEVVSEYRALRASVLRLWSESAREADSSDLDDLTRFNESIDQSLSEAIRSFTSRVEESRELFLATLGHDLRTPLNALVLSSEVLARSGQLDDENVRTARQMANFGHVMAGMINDLLDFTRARLGGGMPVSPAPVDLERLCCDVVEEFRVADPGHPVRVESRGTVTGEWDPARLRQVVSNLVANAIAHGEDGGPIEISVSGDEADVILTVANRGPAIPPAALPTLFDPFVRGPSAASRKGRTGGGTGLGLYIVRQIIVAHRGTISVESSDPAGTRVTVRLPRHPRAEPERRG